MGLNQDLCSVSSAQSVSRVARSMKGLTVCLHQNKQPATLVETRVSLYNLSKVKAFIMPSVYTCLMWVWEKMHNIGMSSLSW